MTFDDQMEDLKLYKETHGHANVTIPEDKSLAQFCAKARHARKNPGKGVKLTDERTAAFDGIGFNWTSQLVSGQFWPSPSPGVCTTGAMRWRGGRAGMPSFGVISITPSMVSECFCVGLAE
jgi:hypothetical protein